MVEEEPKPREARAHLQYKESIGPYKNWISIFIHTKRKKKFVEQKWNSIYIWNEMENLKNFASIGATIVLGKKLGQLKIFRLMRLFYYHTRNFCRICFCWFWWQFLHSRKYPISIKDKPGNPLCEFRMYLGHNGYSPPQFLFPMFL